MKTHSPTNPRARAGVPERDVESTPGDRLLTARDAVDDRISGLDHGADDYITKPFEYGELLARIRALFRRGTASYLEEVQVGDLKLDMRARRVTRGGNAVELSSKEYAVLEYMALRAGELVTREDLSEHVWDESFNAFTNLVEVYMLRLRRKIDSGHALKLIRTRRGEGYVLSAEARSGEPKSAEPKSDA